MDKGAPQAAALSPSVEPVPVSPAAAASIASAFASIAAAIPKGLSWQYKTSIRDSRLYHTWALTGDRGGIHVDAWFSPDSTWGDRWYGGIEGHSPIQHDYHSAQPSHDHCWLLCGPCWHDGSSLQFSEQIAPYLPFADGVMGEYEHREVLSVMLNRYGSWLPEAQEIEARRAETAQQGSVADESAAAKPCAQGDAT